MRRLLLIWIALLALLAGCGPQQAAAPAKPTELRIGMVLMPKGPSLDPMLTTYSNPEFTNLYDSLVVIANDGTVKPALATAWKNVNPTTWQFTLRKGVKYHNGDTVVADDVKYSLDRVRDPANKSPRIPHLAMIKDIQVVDESTVNVTTTQPHAPLPSLMFQLPIVPSKLIKSIGNEAFAAKPVGTGPFKFVEWVKGERIVHEAFDGYWNGAPGVKKVVYLSAPEASTRAAKLLNNEVDLVENILDADIPRLKADARLKTIEAETCYTNWLTINTFQKPFDDKRVRQAMNYAVDVDSIISKVMGGNATRVNVSTGHGNFGYDKSVAPYKYDVAKAKQLLKEAGFDGNFPPQVLDVGQGRQPYNIEVSEAIAGYLTAAGMPTKVNVMESNANFERYLSAKASLIFFANLSTTQDPDGIMGLNLHSKQRGLYYNTPQLDSMIDAARGEFDVEKRRKLYSDITKYMFEEAPHVFLYDTLDVYASRKDLEWDGPLPPRIMPMQSAKYK